MTTVYVFDGLPPLLKENTRKDRQNKRLKGTEPWFELRNKALGALPNDPPFSDADLDKTANARMKMKKPSSIDQASILQILRDERAECVGALYEAKQQLVELEQDGHIDLIISEDGDLISLGGRRVLCKMSRKANGEYYFCHFEHNIFSVQRIHIGRGLPHIKSFLPMLLFCWATTIALA